MMLVATGDCWMHCGCCPVCWNDTGVERIQELSRYVSCYVVTICNVLCGGECVVCY